MSERLTAALNEAAEAETAFERAKASAKVWHAFFLDIEQSQRQRERNSVRAGVHPYTCPIITRERVPSSPPDLDVEISKTMREASERVVTNMQAQQLGEDFKNLPYDGPERRR